MEFKHEAFRLFEEFSIRLREEIGHDLFRFEIVPANPFSLQQLLQGLKLETARSFLPDFQPPAEEQTTR
jgi:preprotein translocase subunit SecA